ncbi:hypothetical protein B4U79_14864 [Dinothrombium tinctorium]|uniref:C2H2-type domain-containing protein n=1 Tax=Dinothrombium tinctorium TaxID=1965070 RepID=A0A443RM31_9ACAR|nr:hypothetical protein B4U79_14864 [Dinothrombium tinctorium]
MSPSESIKRHEEKIMKAREMRERLLEEKAQKYKGKAKKAEEMKAMKEEQQLQIKKSVEIKLQRAEELRKQNLERIVKKAHDEQSKVNEIQFINTLEAENKRYEILTKEKDCEARLHDLQEERQRKLEEKAAKEAAAEVRRKALEAGRQARIEKWQEKRKLKDAKVEQLLQEKEKERQELAWQKAREREQKLSAINAAHQANVEELQKKIQQKLEESTRRHQENKEQIRQKAFELSIRRASSSNEDTPGSIPYETRKMCSLCNQYIGSEVYLYSHLRGKKHQDAIKELHCCQTPSSEELECYNLKYIVDAPASADSDLNLELAKLDKERLKAIKKRCKKLKQKMEVKSKAFETDLAQNSNSYVLLKKSKTAKYLKEISSLDSDTHISGPWTSKMVHSLDRSISELQRLLQTNNNEQNSFAHSGGLHLLCNILNRILDCDKDRPQILPNKTFVHVCNLFEMICSNNSQNCIYVFNSTLITSLLDQLAHKLNASIFICDI